MKAALLSALALGVNAPSFAADAAPFENRFAIDRAGRALRSGQPAGRTPRRTPHPADPDPGPWQGLSDIKVPVLLIAPYFAPDAAQMGMTREMKTAYYTSLIVGTPTLRVVSIAPARHFVMFDQPQMLADAQRAYLQSL